MNIISLVVGDMGGDGHEKIKKRYYRTNLPKQEVKDAYNKGVELLGIDITKYCQEYEDNSVPKEIIDKLLEKGFESEDLDLADIDIDSEEDRHHIYYTVYLDIWEFIAKAGASNLILEKIPDNDINIGGYGLL